MKHHRTRNGQPSITSTIRTLLTDELMQAGDTVTIDPADYPGTLASLRVKVKQALDSESPLTASIRTIGGKIYVKRDNLSTLPGMDPTYESLNALRPWIDDPARDEKNAAITHAIECIAFVKQLRTKEVNQ